MKCVEIINPNNEKENICYQVSSYESLPKYLLSRSRLPLNENSRKIEYEDIPFNYNYKCNCTQINKKNRTKYWPNIKFTIDRKLKKFTFSDEDFKNVCPHIKDLITKERMITHKEFEIENLQEKKDGLKKNMSPILLFPPFEKRAYYRALNLAELFYNDYGKDSEEYKTFCLINKIRVLTQIEYQETDINLAPKYIVKNEDTDWYCTCRAYKNHKKCKHIDKIKKLEIYKQNIRELGISLATKIINK